MTNSPFIFATLLCCCCYTLSALVPDNSDTPTDFKSLLDAFISMQEQLRKVESRLEEQNEEIVQLKAKLSNAVRNTDDMGTPPDLPVEAHDDTTSDQTSENGVSEKEKPQNRVRRADALIDVAFFVKLKSEVHNLGVNQDIIFDEVVTNIGNVYNPHHGVFVAPASGIYVFSTTMLVYSHDYQHYGFALNGNVITVMLANGPEGSGDSDSQTIVLHLNKGDDVSVRTIFDSGSGLYGGGHSIFSGFRLPSVQNSAEIIG